MTLDERIEALAMHLEVLTHMHRDLEKQFQEHLEVNRVFEQRMTQYSADVKDTFARLGRIAAAHDDSLADHEARIEDQQERIDKLEG